MSSASSTPAATGPRAKQLTTLLYAGVLAITLAAGIGFFWPSLQQGLFADDYIAVAMLENVFAAPRGPFDLFDFASGQRADVAALKRLGSIPWWAPPNFRVSFMRPLSSALWHVDRALFGSWLVGYHLHSIAAWSLLVIAAAALYRALLPLSIALLALPMFALDQSLHFPVIWLSNRGGLYAIALGIVGLHAHVRARERGSVAWAALSAAAFSIALAFGEWAFPMLAYVLAYELVEGPGTLGQRARALAPTALLGLLFLYLRSTLGYGATGSGAYVDPGSETGRFLLALVGRVPVFIADMLFNIPSSQWDHGSPWRETMLNLELIPPQLWVRLPEWRLFHALIGFAACALLIALARIGLCGLPLAQRKRMRFLLLGALFSLVPVVGSFPSTRLTMAAFLGVAPLLALTLTRLARSAYRHATSVLDMRRAMLRASLRASLAYVTLLAIVSLHVIDPLDANVGPMIDQHRTTARWVMSAPLDRARVAEQHVYLLASGEFTTTFYFAYIWAANGGAMPRSVQPLVASPFAIDVTRSGPSTLTLHALGGSFLTSGHEHMFRSTSLPTRPAQLFRAGELTVTVRLTDRQHRAQSIEVSFGRPVDDPSHVLLVATPNGFERFPVPALGQTRRVPRAPGPFWPGLEYARTLATIGPLPEVLGYQPVSSALAFESPESTDPR